MYVTELNSNQLLALKQNYLIRHGEEVGDSTSYEELANADRLISNEMIYEEYAGCQFSEDDF